MNQSSQTGSSPARSPLLLELKGVIKSREQGGVSFELQVPDFRVRRGEFVAIIGQSGCGKSTLLDMLALVSAPTVCDQFVFHDPTEVGGDKLVDIARLWRGDIEADLARIRRQHLGYVLQTGGLLPFLSVRNNIMLPLRIKGIPVDEEKLKDDADTMKVKDLFDKKPQFLSGGQRQRIAILRALAHQPVLVLADEPTAAVDKLLAIEIVNVFKELAKERGSTIIMVTHDESLVEGRADRYFSFEVTRPSETSTRSECKETTR